MRRLGLFLSAVAVFFTTTILPLHYHADDATASSKTHCVVCHLLREAGTSNPSPASFSTPSFAEGILIESPFLGLHAPAFIGIHSPRAPPTV